MKKFVCPRGRGTPEKEKVRRKKARKKTPQRLSTVGAYRK
jgi:hypothetical protein